MLKEAVAQGKTLLLAPTTADAAAEPRQDPGGRTAASTRTTSWMATPCWRKSTLRHPLFAPFADSRFSDFTKIHFWNYRKMDFSALTNAQTLARFDNGDPAIVSIPAGKGRVFVFTSGWHPADSQLALSSKFVPLLYSIMELSGAAPPPPAQHFVGATLPIARDHGERHSTAEHSTAGWIQRRS